ncbi:Hypothetical protein HVR_LOCUS1256 [uncultured virus]|nr:Hypothetical protein HVR_LOCUS1256 [uncultured virus]
MTAFEQVRRKTFCSRGTSSIHNGVFIADVPLAISDLVKIQYEFLPEFRFISNMNRHVTRFSPDYIVDDISNYNDSNSVHTGTSSLLSYSDTTFLDILISDNSETSAIYYILGVSGNTYFVLTNKMNTPNNKIILGKFQSPMVFKGNLSLHNGQLYALIPHGGFFIDSHNRPNNISQSGILFTIDPNTLKVSGFRGINLSNNFVMIGGAEEKGREEPLYLLNNDVISRFNPSTSHSWSVPMSKQQFSATTAKDMVILIACDEITALDNNDGHLIWTHKLNRCTDICGVGISDRLYILTIVGNVLTVTQANVTKSGMTIISQKTIGNPTKPNIYCISSWSNSFNRQGYIVWTDTRIYFFNNNNELISTTTLDGISIPRTYRMIPRHSSYNIPVIVNGINTIKINKINTFSDSSNYGGIFLLKESFPQRAGIVTDIVDQNKVYVVTTGNITDILRNLTPQQTYIVYKNGVLTGSYHNINQGRPFLIVGMEPNSASIIYNNI